MSFQAELQTLKANLAQQRDELTLQLGLAKLEARDEWHEIEAKTGQFMSKLETLGEEAADDVVDGVKRLGAEIRHGYDKLKASLQ